MKTAKERQDNFMEDLRALLKKHQAELEITDDRQSYGMHRGVMNVSMDAIYDDDGNVIAEWCDFNLQGYMDHVISTMVFDGTPTKD